MSDPISTPAFIASLNLDQLLRCKELAQKRIDEIRSQERVLIWAVEDADVVLRYFREHEYLQAVDYLVDRARKVTESRYTYRS